MTLILSIGATRNDVRKPEMQAASNRADDEESDGK